MKTNKRIPWGPIVATGIMIGLSMHWGFMGIMVGGMGLALTLENMPEPNTGDRSDRPDTEDVNR